MKDTKKLAIIGGAIVVVGLGSFVAYSTLSKSTGGTVGGAQEEAKAMMASSNKQQVIPEDKYKVLMSKARGMGSKPTPPGP